MFNLFERDVVYKRIEGFHPLVAQWEKSTHPAQIRLTNYLSWLSSELNPSLDVQDELYLHLEVGVRDPSNLLHKYDLENYLTPLFGSKCLESSKFVLVSGRKKVGEESSIEVGKTKRVPEVWPKHIGHHHSCSPGAGASSKKWKENIRSSLAMNKPDLPREGPVEVQLAWRCSTRRNWVNLWKPTGDAMGPVLGYSSTDNLYHPRDDRIVYLAMHKTIDPSLGYDIQVGMWWRENRGDRKE